MKPIRTDYTCQNEYCGHCFSVEYEPETPQSYTEPSCGASAYPDTCPNCETEVDLELVEKGIPFPDPDDYQEPNED